MPRQVIDEEFLMPLEIELGALARTEQMAVRRVTYRFGRRLVGRLKRLLRWEFWPPYIFYTPVIAFIAYLGLRFRSFTLFTAANPAMPASGFVGESKHEILGHLKNAGSCLPCSTLLREGTPDDRLAQAAAFMKKRQLSFPIVLKPDAGQRGSGVVVVRSLQQLQEYLCRASFPMIAQEHVSGREFGVFYFRYPNEKRGRVFSVTEKRMPVVVGDGGRTLEELILADERAVCMADFYLRNNSERAHDVLAAGEKVQLVEIGTHCRGAIFLDGSYAITPTLEATIERIASTFDGFFFGRFDIRVPTVEDFMSGQNLKIIELNGVTSEATHIYDPKLSLVDAYRVLFEQWRIAFEIAHKNRERGVRPSSVTELFRMIRDYRGLARKYPE
ncbi:MAG: hypothetical protein JO159_08920 [Acidobacteria bacterium]|nr:hypothetical protein [Acidobacteriota bacterium]